MSKKLLLDDFTKNLTGKSKLILSLLSTGEYSFNLIRKLTVADLKKKRALVKKKWPDLADTLDELIFGCSDDEIVFRSSEYRNYSLNDIRDILVRAYNKCGLKYKSLDDFVKLISKK